ncbi:hypothetical protein LAZ67_19001875 [Cordylochernes scorpioides]|uniref:Uncharacterized protein n=1 Tax=Cordylochernes scorpioides TaxID=51811 RepID=A0ABY6LI20_9ARAC|nr:hypothetical protein LAZ67_19001875 [Cordylochernes scorpioides]
MKTFSDPDTTRSDGLYSRYLSPHLTSPGLYLVVVQARVPKSSYVLKEGSIVLTKLHPFGESRCCGSRVERLESASPPEPFQLQGAAVSLAVQGRLPVLPPGRVTDLTVERLEVRDHQHVVSLAWTELGAYLDHGIASEFILKFFHSNREDIPWQFDRATQVITTWSYFGGSGPKPKGYGTRQSVSIVFHERPQKPQESWKYPLTIYLALKTQSGDLTSPVSNIATVYLDELPPETTTYSYNSTTNSNATPTTSHIDNKSYFGTKEIGILVGSLLAFVAIIAIILVILACRRGKKKNEEKQTSAPPNGHPSVIHTITSDINPIQAWPAEVLLDHYDRVQDAKMHHQAPPVLSLSDVIDGISIATSSHEGSQGGDTEASIRQRQRLAALPIFHLMSRWQPHVDLPFTIGWSSLRRSAFSGHNADVAIRLALHALPHPAHPASVRESCIACGPETFNWPTATGTRNHPEQQQVMSHPKTQKGTRVSDHQSEAGYHPSKVGSGAGGPACLPVILPRLHAR